MAVPVASNSACRVTLEYENGMVFTGMVIMAELIVEPGYATVTSQNNVWGMRPPKLTEWELTLRGLDTPYMEMPREKYREQVIGPARTAREWKCDRCGAVWPREVNQCGACGFWRPFVYE